MIQSFRDRESEGLFRRAVIDRLPVDVGRAALRRLVYLNAALDLHDLSVPPDFRLSRLGGEREGQYALHIAESWYVCFECRRGDPLGKALDDLKRQRIEP